MKGYRKFIITFSILMVLYVLKEIYRPKPIDWTITLSKNDKIPYGGYVLFNQLKDIFPFAKVQSYRTPLYSQVNNFNGENTAYILLSPTFMPSGSDMKEMMAYVRNGNYIFAAANSFSKNFLDSFQLKTGTRFSLITEDSTTVNFVNPKLKAKENYGFLRSTIDQYFSKVNTANAIIVSVNNYNEPDFIKVPYGEGAFLIHANPICFSNYFLLHKDNASYTSKALSYLPSNISSVFWDEYYKSGRGEARTPLRFILSNEFLRWALRLSLIGLVLYVLFQVKRRQRIIPVIEPLPNSTLDFINTVSAVYYNEKDNRSIANKKMSYFLEFIRHRFNLSTTVLDDTFTEQLARKSGVIKEDVQELVEILANIAGSIAITDHSLIVLNNKIDQFYKQL